MGRWWTGYTSISAGRLGIAHSHGEPWRFAATERLQPVYGYGLWKAKIPSEKMCSIAVCGGAGCEAQAVDRKEYHEAELLYHKAWRALPEEEMDDRMLHLTFDPLIELYRTQQRDAEADA